MKDQTRDEKTSGTQKKNRSTGARLGMRGVVATALLESGVSIPKTCKAAKISQTTAVFLKKHKVMPRDQVDALKNHLQAKFACIAAEALEAIDAEKYQEAGFGELVRGAVLATQHAGISAPNVQEYYRALFLAKYTIQAESKKTSGTTSAHTDSPDTDTPAAD